ncbi:MAG: hypothetical protein LBP52_08215 [Burkholderiaceae bacterium]|nr:hypothetical protein [Burkholderiaceae bacterium]
MELLYREIAALQARRVVLAKSLLLLNTFCLASAPPARLAANCNFRRGRIIKNLRQRARLTPYESNGIFPKQKTQGQLAASDTGG